MTRLLLPIATVFMVLLCLPARSSAWLGGCVRYSETVCVKVSKPRSDGSVTIRFWQPGWRTGGYSWSCRTTSPIDSRPARKSLELLREVVGTSSVRSGRGVGYEREFGGAPEAEDIAEGAGVQPEHAYAPTSVVRSTDREVPPTLQGSTAGVDLYEFGTVGCRAALGVASLWVVAKETDESAPPERLMVSEKRKYRVTKVSEAKELAAKEAASWGLEAPTFGLPEIDDRYHIWRVPILSQANGEKVGEVVIDARSSRVDLKKSSDPAATLRRLGELEVEELPKPRRDRRSPIVRSELRNTLMQGDSEETLAELPAESVDLAFTSPPYFNARPDYTDYVSYEDYLLKIRKVLQQSHRLLAEGRFFVMNVSPVLLRRASRSKSSRRIAVPFDMHRLFIEEGYEFIDDIIWVKPSGAGWATGRGRRFAADRNPLQYKTVPVTEYVLVYRKATERLIDWNIRNHHDADAVERSRISGEYDATNVWEIKPAHSKKHPAIFPLELAERVVKYYSFEGDVVMDPFAGIGTTGEAAAKLGRRFVLSELDPEYVSVIRGEIPRWIGAESADVLCVGCEQVDTSGILF